MNHLSNGAAARTAAASALVAVLLVSGCAQAKTAGNTNAEPTQQAGVTKAQLEELRSVPASEPMAGPAVSSLFSLADIESFTGIQGLQIEGISC